MRGVLIDMTKQIRPSAGASRGPEREPACLRLRAARGPGGQGAPREPALARLLGPHHPAEEMFLAPGLLHVLEP